MAYKILLRCFMIFKFVSTITATDSYLNNCGSMLPMVGKNFQIPKTFLAQPGKTIHLKFDLIVKEQITQKLVLDLVIEKSFFIMMKIPCFGGKIGSCRYNLPCKSLNRLGLPCRIEPGVYHIDGPVRIPTKISIPSFIARGTYKIMANIREKDSSANRKLGCFEGILNVDL